MFAIQIIDIFTQCDIELIIKQWFRHIEREHSMARGSWSSHEKEIS